jgi:integrase
MKNLLDFEVDRGTKVINLKDLREVLQHFEYAHPYRINLLLLTLSMRTKEPHDLTWHNFDNGLIIFRPGKQHGKCLRKIKVPNRIWTEIMTYRTQNFFKAPGKLFNYTHHSFRRLFNEMRPKFGGNWAVKSDNYRLGRVSQYYLYGLHNFRTTAATLAYHYYSMVYGHGDMALTQTCLYMGHSCNKMTAQYYVKRVSDLGLENFPKLSYLELLDHIIYGETQEKICKYTSERQALAIEY